MKKLKPKLPSKRIISPLLAASLFLTLVHCAQPPPAQTLRGSGDSLAEDGDGPVGDSEPNLPAIPKPSVPAGSPAAPVSPLPSSSPSPAPLPGSPAPKPLNPPASPPMTKPEDIVTDPGTEGDGSFDLDSNYTVAPETVKNDKYPHGEFKSFTMNSGDSKIYRGEDSYLKEKGSFSRQGWLYLPPGYVAGTEIPFMFVGDGSWSQHSQFLRWTLDALIAQKKVPAMAAIFLNPGPLGGGDGPGSQRSFEYDSVTEKFTTFVETEVLPKLTKDYGVKFTSNPEGRGTMGGSSSAAMAFTMAWFRPDLYRRVLTYSGTFVNRIQTGEHPQGAWEYHSKMIPASERKPIRVTLHASQNDNNFGSDNNWLQANRNMAKVLKDKGYHYRFQYAPNAGHIDSKVYAETLPENLIWLWRGYPIK